MWDTPVDSAVLMFPAQFAHSPRTGGNDMAMKRVRSAVGAAAVAALAGCLGLATVPGTPAQAQNALKLTSYVPVGSGTWNLYH